MDARAGVRVRLGWGCGTGEEATEWATASAGVRTGRAHASVPAKDEEGSGLVQRYRETSLKQTMKNRCPFISRLGEESGFEKGPRIGPFFSIRLVLGSRSPGRPVV